MLGVSSYRVTPSSSQGTLIGFLSLAVTGDREGGTFRFRGRGSDLLLPLPMLRIQCGSAHLYKVLKKVIQYFGPILGTWASLLSRRLASPGWGSQEADLVGGADDSYSTSARFQIKLRETRPNPGSEGDVMGL